VEGKVDIINSTFGKALGGAAGLSVVFCYCVGDRELHSNGQCSNTVITVAITAGMRIILR